MMADKNKEDSDLSAKVVSSTKRLTVLNEQEHVHLRRKLGFYSKIHEKELSSVEKQLGEIKKVIKTMSRDNLLGSRVLEGLPAETNIDGFLPAAEGKSPNHRKLLRAQSFPSSFNADKSSSEIPAAGKQEIDKAAVNRRNTEGRDNERAVLSSQRSHRKISRSHTTPVSFPQPPQPLIKTTPELVRRKFNQTNSLHRELSRSHSGESNKLQSSTPFPPKMPVLVRHQASSVSGGYSTHAQTPLRTSQATELIKLDLNVERPQSSPAVKNPREKGSVTRASNNGSERQTALQAKYSTTWNKREKEKSATRY